MGDTGGIMKPQFQFAVADAMALDTASVAANGASFWYHLGDVVYYFGQDQYYFEQFYDPYRNYNAPIFAIPGNHDGVLFSGEAATSLAAFLANFCSAQPTNNPDSQGVVRTTMDQPGVYFTLNAPFVKFIGLYSNTGEGGTQGVIASPKVGNAQLDFLAQQLAAAKAERAAGQGRALIIATHHPPFTGSPFHVPSPDMLAMIDQACTAAGIWPDLHLSGHSHLYERYTRTIGGKQIPYVVAGMGGFYNLPGLKAHETRRAHNASFRHRCKRKSTHDQRLHRHAVWLFARNRNRNLAHRRIHHRRSCHRQNRNWRHLYREPDRRNGEQQYSAKKGKARQKSGQKLCFIQTPGEEKDGVKEGREASAEESKNKNDFGPQA